MKAPVLSTGYLALALICCPAVAAEPPAVVAQNLTQLRVPDKVEAVLWTRRADQYTLQIVFPRSGRILPLAQGRREVGQAPGQRYPAIYAWLLKSDGTLIAPNQRLAVSPALQATPVRRGAPDSADRMEVMYQYPLAAGTDAVAVALRIDGEFRIEKLEPMPGR